jgi:plasmid stabilization system protein ParE
MLLFAGKTRRCLQSQTKVHNPLKVEWSGPALRDLAGKIAYLKRHNPLAAVRVARAIREAADQLGGTPRLGRPGRVPGTFELVTVWPYVIVYEIEKIIEIRAVWHGAQDRPE